MVLGPSGYSKELVHPSFNKGTLRQAQTPLTFHVLSQTPILASSRRSHGAISFLSSMTFMHPLRLPKPDLS